MFLLSRLVPSCFDLNFFIEFENADMHLGIWATSDCKNEVW